MKPGLDNHLLLLQISILTKKNCSGGQDKTSTERSRKFQQNLYKKKDAHEVVKAKDRLWKISTFAQNWLKRQTEKQFAMKNREKERLKKQKYRAKLALMKNKTNNSTKSIKKKKKKKKKMLYDDKQGNMAKR